MDFQWPFMLWLLLLIPALVMIYIGSQRRRQRYVLRYASLSVVKEALGKGPGKRRHIFPALLLAGFIAMIIGLARPQMVTALPVQEGTVMLVMDVSGSMDADDMKPSRIEAAKAAARDFVQRQPEGIKIGLVSFSDDASVVQAPTSSREDILAAIDRLTSQGGTAIGSGILVALQTIFEKSDMPVPSDIQDLNANIVPVPQGTYAPAIIVLLTDGENNEGPDPIIVSRAALVRGVRVYTVGIGSAQGTVLHIQGQLLRTNLDETTLKNIAGTTNAKYYNASSATDLRSIYENLDTHFVIKTQRMEVTAGFTGLAVFLSLAGVLISMLWFNRFP